MESLTEHRVDLKYIRKCDFLTCGLCVACQIENIEIGNFVLDRCAND